MKIILVQHQYFLNGTGGAEKMCSFLANGFNEMGHEVEIATNENIVGKPMYPLHNAIKVTNIFSPTVLQIQLKPLDNYSGKNPLKWLIAKYKKKQAKYFNKQQRRKYGDDINEFNLKKRAAAWKNYFEQSKPDLVLTMSLESVLEITYGNTYSFPVVNSVNGRPDYDYASPFWTRNPREEFLLREAFGKLAGIQILFENYQDFIPETFTGECFVIPNPVPQQPEADKVNHLSPKERYTLTNIARLDDAGKQQSLIITIFAEIAYDYPNWDVTLWGIGPDFNVLQSLIVEKGMQNRIFLKGFTDSPLERLKDADLFIFPSKYEGFGLALVEAMTVGLPVLGFKSCSGVNELIEHGYNGYLATDKDDLKKLLIHVMKSPELRQEMGTAGKLSVQKYAPELILEKWKALLQQIEEQLS